MFVMLLCYATLRYIILYYIIIKRWDVTCTEHYMSKHVAVLDI